MVKTSGLEPPTPCMSSRYSNQLSYAFIVKWLGWLDSDQRMTESKSVALPLGYTPVSKNKSGVDDGTQTHDLQSHNLAL